MKSNTSISFKRIGSRLLDVIIIIIASYIFYFLIRRFGAIKTLPRMSFDSASGTLREVGSRDYQTTLMIVLPYYFFVLLWLYYFSSGYKSGQTLGDKFFRIKIKKVTGENPSRAQLFLRDFIIIYPVFLLAFFDHMILIAHDDHDFALAETTNNFLMVSGALMLFSFIIIPCTMFFSKTGRALHDILAKTKVIANTSDLA